MTSRGRKYVLGCAGAAVLVIGLLVAGVYGYGVYMRNSNEQEALAIAQQLGMRPGDQLVARRKCWAMGTECGQAIVFTTPLTRDALRNSIARLGFQQRTGDGYASGNGLFTAINIGTEHSITVDGATDTLSLPDEKIPSARDWVLVTPMGKQVHIVLYETSSKPVVYAFDSRPIRENVIELLLWDNRP